MKIFRSGLVCAAIVGLCACSTLQPVRTGRQMIGSDQAAVRGAFGQPTETYQLAGGTSRWIYSTQPFGYEVYAADFDAAGKLSNFRQMLTEEEIYRAQVGVWTKRDVEQHFGKPHEPVQYYPLMKREAWSYRMYQAGYQASHFSCYFDDSGVLQQTMIIADPLGGGRRHAR